MGTTNVTGDSTAAFVAKLDAAGAKWIYVVQLGGTAYNSVDFGNAIAVDRSGEVYIAGLTTPEFPVTNGAYQTKSGSDRSAWVAKLSPLGALRWATYLGGDGESAAQSIAVDSAGNIFVAGYAEHAHMRRPVQSRRTAAGAAGSCTVCRYLTAILALKGLDHPPTVIDRTMNQRRSGASWWPSP